MDTLPLNELIEAFRRGGAVRFFAKRLSSNDNSKNQVYLGGGFPLLNELPLRNLRAVPSDTGRSIIHADFPLSWLDDTGRLIPAPHSKAILYPQYPEVRWSGFLRGAEGAPNSRINAEARIPGRVLVLGIRSDRTAIARVHLPDSPLAKELEERGVFDQDGVLVPILVESPSDTRDRLLAELLRVSELGWLAPVRLRQDGTLDPCRGTNCGGVTLESHLGIVANSRADPDLFGWEIKQFAVNNFTALRAKSPVTLFTPEPTEGVYSAEGVETFIRRYGYPDRQGRPDRLNVGGRFVVGRRLPLTGLRLELEGINSTGDGIHDAEGGIRLVDDDGRVAAKWPFASLLEHWNHKHARAAYVPSMQRSEPSGYRYAPACYLGIGTDFGRFLLAMSRGAVFYDPGIKLERASEPNPACKRRSQFRISFHRMTDLYERFESVVLGPVS